MAFPNSTRLAWSVAIASLALWATSVPMTWGQVAAGASRLVDETLAPTNDEQAVTDDGTSTSVPCLAVPPTPVPAAVVPAPVPDNASSAPAGASSGTFHVCGPDSQAEQAIAQLIGGRGFSASLSAHGDGCADLTINVSPQPVGGTAASRLAVSLGAQRTLKLDITSQAGITHVSIGQDQ
jgi:hypothetical protein